MLLVAGPFEEYELPDSLMEGKGLHSLLVRDDIRQAVIDAGFDMSQGKFRTARRSSTSHQKKKFEDLVAKTQTALISTTMDFLSQRKNPRVKSPMSRTRWETTIKNALRTAYDSAFQMGLESSGVSKYRAGVAQSDKDYIESAVREEMRYFNRLIKQIDQGKVRGRMMDRLSAYADALKHIYYAGRVMGTPKGMIIDWIAPMDRNTCGGCKFLFLNSPYTKRTLPTTPRAGDTPCLNKCRCRLVMRTVAPAQFERVDQKHNAKSTYARKLAAIKKGKAL